MKKLFSTLLSILILSQARPVHAFDSASTDALVERSPLATQQALDSDIRLRSMGGLDLPVQDESNWIGAFKYGGSPVGLPLDYSQSKAELQLWTEAGEVDASSSADGTLFDSDRFSVGGMVAHKISINDESEGALAFSYMGEMTKADLTSQGAAVSGLRSEEDTLDITSLSGGYGHRFGQLLAGLWFSQAKLESEIEIVTLGGTPNSIKGDFTTTSIQPAIGLLLSPHEERELTLYLGPEFVNEETDGSIGATSPNEIDGVWLRLGAVYAASENRLRSALTFRTGEQEGDRSDGANVEDKTTEVKWKTFYRTKGRLSFGSVIEWYRDEMDATSGGTLLDDDDVESAMLGLGTAYHLAGDRGLVGVEARFLNEETDSETFTGFNEKDSGTEVRMGGEFLVLPKWWLRGGVMHRNLTEEDSNGLEEDNETLGLNLGVEYLLGEQSSLILAFNNTGINSVGEDFTGNSLSLLGRFRFGAATQ